jgi:hypothetical protein
VFYTLQEILCERALARANPWSRTTPMLHPQRGRILIVTPESRFY